MATTMLDPSTLEGAIQDFKDGKLYQDGNGNWRYNNSATGPRNGSGGKGIHPGNKALKKLGKSWDEIYDYAHGHIVPNFEHELARTILRAVTGGYDELNRIHAESRARHGDGESAKCYRNPAVRQEIYGEMVKALARHGITLNRAEPFLLKKAP